MRHRGRHSMGERNVRPAREQLRAWTKTLLDDLQALEIMIDRDMIESGVRRIGVEQEMFLIDPASDPAMTAVEVLGELDPEHFTTELGRFNIEANLEPQSLAGDGLWRIENELREHLSRACEAAARHDSRVLLAGILPTIKQSHLTLDSIMPEPRYKVLNDSICERRGGRFQLVIKGVDELRTTHDNVMMEACNTSFQVHFQVGPGEFANLYNIAQLVTAPVLAASVYSPFFLQRRLWQETRLALFQQSVDVRSENLQARRARPRVTFGEAWIKDSVLEIFRDDVARFRVLLAGDFGETALAVLERGEIPELKALRLHNGTVYRWNRPCYGICEGEPHLRIEHRALPSGPSVVDEMANAALFFGLMSALSEEHRDVTRLLDFHDVKDNVFQAARYGLNAQFQWIDGNRHSAQDLVLKHLVPAAREGLQAKKVRSQDIDRYLGVVEERVKSGQTGSRWALDSLAAMSDHAKPDERFRVLTAAMYRNQMEGRPVHEWPVATLGKREDWRDSYRYVEQVMTTDLFTVGPEDLVDLAANLMDWEHIRHVPVEDPDGRLVGLVSHRQLLRLVGRGLKAGAEPVAVREIMTPTPITVSPRTGSLEAIRIMRQHKVSCLPVVDGDNKLVGIVSERDFINVAALLLEDKLGEIGGKPYPNGK